MGRNGRSGKLMSVCLLAGFGVVTFSCFAAVRKEFQCILLPSALPQAVG